MAAGWLDVWCGAGLVKPTCWWRVTESGRCRARRGCGQLDADVRVLVPVRTAGCVCGHRRASAVAREPEQGVGWWVVGCAWRVRLILRVGEGADADGRVVHLLPHVIVEVTLVLDYLRVDVVLPVHRLIIPPTASATTENRPQKSHACATEDSQWLGRRSIPPTASATTTNDEATRAPRIQDSQRSGCRSFHGSCGLGQRQPLHSAAQ